MLPLRSIVLFLAILCAPAVAQIDLSWKTIPSPASQNLWGVCANGPLFVAVGEAGTILTSTDGTAWTARTSGTTEWLVGVCHGGDQYVVVGEHGTILTSVDGISWVSRSIGGLRLNNVAYGGGRFVAVGQKGTIVTSTDALHWTARSVPLDGWLRGIVYLRGRFYVGGQDGVLFSTKDGDRFDLVSSSGRAIEALATNGDLLHYTGDYLWRGSAEGPLDVGYFRGATCYGETSVGVGEGGLVVVLKVGLIPTWSYASKSITNESLQNLNAVAANEVAVIAVGNTGTILRSTDSATAPNSFFIGGPEVTPVTPYSGRPFRLQAEDLRGGPVMNYQWKRNGQLLPNSNSASLDFPAATSVDLGSYELTASNRLGSKTWSFQVTALRAPPSESIDRSFHTEIASSNAGSFIPSKDGRWLTLFGSSNRAPLWQRLNTDGSWDTTFHAEVSAQNCTELTSGRLVVHGYRLEPPLTEIQGAWLLDSEGKLLRPIAEGLAPLAIVPLNAGKFVFVSAAANGIALTRHHADGSSDPQYGPITLTGPRPDQCTFTVDDQDQIYLAASSGATLTSTLVRLLPDGTVDGSFAPATVSDPIYLMWWRRGKICYDTGLIRSESTHSPLPYKPRSFAKLTANGEPDLSFQRFSGSNSLEGLFLVGVFDTEGGLLIGGDGMATGLEHYDPSGKRDPSTDVLIDGTILSVAMARDGSVLVSGSSIDGVPGSVTKIWVPTHDYTTRLANLSVRTIAGRDEQTLITGFIIRGIGGSRSIFARGVGPGLVPLGIPSHEIVPDPYLTLFSGQSPIARNDDWDSALESTANRLGAFPLAVGSKDAATLFTLTPGPYTMHVTNNSGSAGIALLELYDASDTPGSATEARLVNLSGRAHVGTGSDVLIAGFVLTGHSVRRLLIRAIGPGLKPYGLNDVLDDPELMIHHGEQVIAANDNWDPSIASAFAQVGAFIPSSGSKDSALVIDLPPGVYTAMARGVGGTTGTALIEVYEVP